MYDPRVPLGTLGSVAGAVGVLRSLRWDGRPAGTVQAVHRWYSVSGWGRARWRGASVRFVVGQFVGRSAVDADQFGTLGVAEGDVADQVALGGAKVDVEVLVRDFL